MSPDTLAFIRDYDLISPGDQVICALSGGKDSMCLLHQLLELQPVLRFQLSAAHFNHQLRGAESQRDQAFVTRHCEALGIPLFVGTGDVAAYAEGHHMGLEEAARTLRYDYLLGLSPTAKIATAHTAEDNLETMLLHLIRGSGLHGLTGIPQKRDRIIRPLLLTDRRAIGAYLESHHIPHVEDSSNESDFCLRNRLRHHVLPLFLEENPNLPRSASALCLELLQEDQYLQQAAQEALNGLLSHSRLEIKKLLALPENMRFRVLKRYLNPVPQLQRKHLEDCIALLGHPSPSASLSLPGGYTFRREYEYALLEKQERSAPPESTILLPNQQVSFGPWLVTCSRGPAPKGAVALTVPPEGYLTLRPRQPGDRITLPGGTKKLSRYLIDKKIPAAWRDTLPVVLLDGALAAVLPLGADINFSANAGDDSLVLTAIRMEEVK